MWKKTAEDAALDFEHVVSAPEDVLVGAVSSISCQFSD
jgi:hypothetical protein